jgi:hypothetical protein
MEATSHRGSKGSNPLSHRGLWFRAGVRAYYPWLWVCRYKYRFQNHGNHSGNSM